MDTPQVIIWFRFVDILGQSITFTVNFLGKAVVHLEVYLGFISCGPVSEGRESFSANVTEHVKIVGMQCVVYGLRSNKMTSHFLNLCSNAGRTHSSHPGKLQYYSDLCAVAQFLDIISLPID